MLNILFKEKIPKFVFLSCSLKNYEVPIFIFHRVNPEEFTSFLQHLKRNNYYTLETQEFYEYITSDKKIPLKSVLLTFDDGLLNNWVVVYPILKKFDMKATLFVTPQTVEDREVLRPNLEDFWSGKLCIEDLRDDGLYLSYISWQEAAVMQESGLIDIQSHTLRHQHCFISPKIIDFQYPDSKNLPKYRWFWTSVDAKKDEGLWGAPVYEFRSRMVSKRYFDDSMFRQACMDFVKDNGGMQFFNNKNWQKILKKFVKKYRSRHIIKDRYETDKEQVLAIRRCLSESRQIITERLNKACKHLSLPWNEGNNLTLRLIKETGYKTNFSGTNPSSFARFKSNPYCLNRTEGYWIGFLPGKGRISLSDKFKQRLCAVGR